MRTRVLCSGLVAISILLLAGPASAKAAIAEASITGPGLGGGLRIEGSDTDGLWESGIDVAGGLDDTRAESVEGLGRAPAELGPRYLVTYRFGVGRGSRGEFIRQDLYPYAKGGPVTYTSPGQKVEAGITMSITAGWYQGSLGFFQYLVDQGLPETGPVASAASGPAADAAPGARSWAWIMVALVGLIALLLAGLVLRRRVPAVARVNR